MGTPSAVDKHLNGASRRCSSWEHFRFVSSSLEFEVELAVIVPIVVVIACYCLLFVLQLLLFFIVAALS